MTDLGLGLDWRRLAVTQGPGGERSSQHKPQHLAPRTGPAWRSLRNQEKEAGGERGGTGPPSKPGTTGKRWQEPCGAVEACAGDSQGSAMEEEGCETRPNPKYDPGRSSDARTLSIVGRFTESLTENFGVTQASLNTTAAIPGRSVLLQSLLFLRPVPRSEG